MKLKLGLIFTMIFSGLTYAQIQPSVSTTLRYGNGEKIFSGFKKEFIYREILSDARLRLNDEFTIGFRLLYDDPPEIGQKFKGLSRRFIEYRKDELYLRVGDFSELYGRGLALNLFEERGLAYDTWMDGLNAKYEYKNLEASLIAGSMTFADSINFWREEEYSIVGGNLEYEFNKNFELGFSFINAEGKIPSVGSKEKLKAEIPEIYLSADLGDFAFYFDYSHKWTEVITNGTTSDGYGFYASMSYNIPKFGITIDYKSYKFDERNPYERYDFTRSTRMLPFQSPPIVKKEHSFVLLSRSLHQVDFNDEVGLQIDGIFTLDESTSFNFNASASSRHNLWKLQPNGFDFELEKRSGNYFPSFDDEYSPFWEFMVDVDRYFGYYTLVNLGFARRAKTIYNDITGLAGSHTIRSTVVPMLVQHTFSRNFAATFQYEYEWVYDNFNTKQERFFNQFISLAGTFFGKLSLTTRYEFTNNDYEVSGRKDWITFEAGYRVTQKLNILLSAGRERGGQTCSNGVCRYIQPFTGFRLTLLSSI